MYRRFTSLTVFGTVGLALALSGCSSGLSPEQLDEELAKVRAESQASDDQISSRLDALYRRVSGLEGDINSLRDEFDVTVEQMQGMLRFAVPVHFAYDAAEVRDMDRPVLDRFAGIVSTYYSESLVTVEGFTDPAGSAEYNLRLGMRRAEAVRDVLTTAGGLASDRVKAVSYGESKNRQVVPGAHGPGAQGIENRRVALVIDYAGGVYSTSQ